MYYSSASISVLFRSSNAMCVDQLSIFPDIEAVELVYVTHSHARIVFSFARTCTKLAFWK